LEDPIPSHHSTRSWPATNHSTATAMAGQGTGKFMITCCPSVPLLTIAVQRLDGAEGIDALQTRARVLSARIRDQGNWQY